MGKKSWIAIYGITFFAFIYLQFLIGQVYGVLLLLFILKYLRYYMLQIDFSIVQ